LSIVVPAVAWPKELFLRTIPPLLLLPPQAAKQPTTDRRRTRLRPTGPQPNALASPTLVSDAKVFSPRATIRHLYDPSISWRRWRFVAILSMSTASPDSPLFHRRKRLSTRVIPRESDVGFWPF